LSIKNKKNWTNLIKIWEKYINILKLAICNEKFQQQWRGKPGDAPLGWFAGFYEVKTVEAIIVVGISK